MNVTEFLQTGLFTAFLTACVTVATCIISTVQGYKKMKLENFDKIQDSIIRITEERMLIVEKCNDLVEKTAKVLPEKSHKISEKEWKNLCYAAYSGINDLLTEYSKCLELMLSISHYLYRNKPISPIVAEECWSILKLYESFVALNCERGYKIKYAQIVTLVQFIMINGRWRDRRQIKRYLKKNEIFPYASSIA